MQLFMQKVQQILECAPALELDGFDCSLLLAHRLLSHEQFHRGKTVDAILCKQLGVVLCRNVNLCYQNVTIVDHCFFLLLLLLLLVVVLAWWQLLFFQLCR